MRARRTRFERAARRLAQALGADECVLVGGLAVVAHGYVRATRDVDLLTRLPLSEARRRLEGKGIPTRLRRGDPFEGDFSCLKGEVEGVPFDVLPQLVPIDWDRTLPLFESRPLLRLVAVEDLLTLKMRARGPKDLMDAAVLSLLHPETSDRARELAVAYRVVDRFEEFLADPRLVRHAREEAAAERRRSRVRPGPRSTEKRNT